MKFDKILFSCSEVFAPFWNLQAKIWKTNFGVEPVCLYFSDTKDGMSEEYGEVILQNTKDYGEEYGNDANIVQITMSKFWHPMTEPDTVWFIGDIDMFPLQQEYFSNLEDIKHGDYWHLNASGVVQHNHPFIPNTFIDFFVENGSHSMGGEDVPGHYHLATGKTFQDVLFPNGKTIDDALDEIILGTYTNPFCEDNPIQGKYWCAEEEYSSRHLCNSCRDGVVKFKSKEYCNRTQRCGSAPNQVCDRNFHNGKYITSTGMPITKNWLDANNIVDIHCYRPYHEQENHLKEILKSVNML